MKREFPDYSIKSREISYCPVKFASFFNSQVKLLLPIWRRELRADNTKSKHLLGIQYREASETLRAMGETLIAQKQVPDKRRH